jgi:hypothetical protein
MHSADATCCMKILLAASASCYMPELYLLKLSNMNIDQNCKQVQFQTQAKLKQLRLANQNTCFNIHCGFPIIYFNVLPKKLVCIKLNLFWTSLLFFLKPLKFLFLFLAFGKHKIAVFLELNYKTFTTVNNALV